MEKIRKYTPLEAEVALKGLAGPGDPEATHGMADDILIGFIRFLGFDEIADAWEKVDKWYA